MMMPLDTVQITLSTGRTLVVPVDEDLGSPDMDEMRTIWRAYAEFCRTKKTPRMALLDQSRINDWSPDAMVRAMQNYSAGLISEEELGIYLDSQVEGLMS